MQTKKLENYKKILEAKRKDLVRANGDRDEIHIEKAADEFDQLQLAMNRELAIRNLDRGAALLRNVEAALKRIAEGEYGVCAMCEEEIPEKRLNAVPWAAHCVACQEVVDRSKDSPEDEEDEHVALRVAS